jgi:hypothetical protein
LTGKFPSARHYTVPAAGQRQPDEVLRSEHRGEQARGVPVPVAIGDGGQGIGQQVSTIT